MAILSSILPSNDKDFQTTIGLLITRDGVVVSQFSKKNAAIDKSSAVQLPEDTFNADLDILEKPDNLKYAIKSAIQSAGLKRVSKVHLGLPATLLRLVDMPKMDNNALSVSLPNEAERFKAFENTDAVVDFKALDLNQQSNSEMTVLLAASREDTFNEIIQILKTLKIKPVSVSLEPLETLRGMAATGVLDSLIQQLDQNTLWGIVFADHNMARFMVWQSETLVELREISMPSAPLNSNTPDMLVIDDLADEMLRTAKKEKPAIWLTINLSNEIQKHLTERLQCPVTSVPYGNAVNIHTAIPLAGIGLAMRSIVNFPFSLNLVNGLNKRSEQATQDTTTSAALQDKASESPQWLIPAGLTSLASAGALCFVLYLMTMMTANELPGLTTDVSQLNVELTALKVQENELRQQLKIDAALKEQIYSTKAKNNAFLKLTNTLTGFTPKDLWLQTITVDNALKFAGKALSHKSIIYFAKRFDEAAVTETVLVDTIEEDRLGVHRVYNFEVSGKLHWDTATVRDAFVNNTETEAELDTAVTFSPDNEAEAMTDDLGV
ncbi:MAG: pilus assembly protein PilM [Cyanobacteria bacterium P01_H01_bin.74]